MSRLRPRVARRPSRGEDLRKRLQCLPSQQTARNRKRRKDAPRLDRTGDRRIGPTAREKGTRRKASGPRIAPFPAPAGAHSGGGDAPRAQMPDGVGGATGLGQHLGEGNVRETHQPATGDGESAQRLIRPRQPGVDVARGQTHVVVRVEPLPRGGHRRPHLPRHVDEVPAGEPLEPGDLTQPTRSSPSPDGPTPEQPGEPSVTPGRERRPCRVEPAPFAPRRRRRGRQERRGPRGARDRGSSC